MQRRSDAVMSSLISTRSAAKYGRPTRRWGRFRRSLPAHHRSRRWRSRRLGTRAAASPDLKIGRVQAHQDERHLVQTAPTELLYRVKILADPRHRRLRHARGAPQRFDKAVDLSGRRAGDVDGYDHRPHSSTNHAAPLKHLGEGAAHAKPREPDLDVARRDGQ